MIRDRGTIKWTAMMLPEHVKMLRDWTEEDTHMVKPELDEQRLEEMNDMLYLALEEGSELLITYYEHKQHRLLIGHVHHYDQVTRKLHIVDKFGTPHYIAIEEVIDVRRQ